MKSINSIEQLEALYGTPGEAALAKELDRLTPAYRRYIEAAPFLALATTGPQGLDCSPRGETPAVVHIRDDKTLHLPDRRGNNRLDSLHNIVRDPRVAPMFLIPGSDNTLRVSGTARLLVETSLLERYAIEGKTPRAVIEIDILRVYFQCARALMRANLWAPDAPRPTLPSAGDMLKEAMGGRFDGEGYDKDWPERAKRSMW